MSNVSDICSDSRISFVRMVYDCTWRFRPVAVEGIRKSYFYPVKGAQMALCAGIAAGNLLALVIYSRLISRNLDIKPHGYLLALALIELLHQTSMGVEKIDLLMQPTESYKQIRYLLPYVAWVYISRGAIAAGDGIYAARNYWVLILMLNRCRALNKFGKHRKPAQEPLWRRLRCPFFLALFNALFWIGAIVLWQLTLNRVSVNVCEKGQQLKLLTTDNTSSIVADSENWYQVTKDMGSCLDPTENLLSYIHLAYFTLIVYLPFVVTIACCVIIWFKIRRTAYPARYARVKRILVVISVTFAILETPIFLVRIASDAVHMLHADRAGPTDYEVALTILTVTAEFFSSLHSLSILLFYLYSDPTFRKHAYTVLCGNAGTGLEYGSRTGLNTDRAPVSGRHQSEVQLGDSGADEAIQLADLAEH